MFSSEISFLEMIFILLFSVDYKISSITFLCLGSFAIIFYALTKLGSTKRGEKIQYSAGQKIKTISQSINSIKQIKILSKENFVNDIFGSHIDDIENNDFIQKIIMSLPKVFFELIAILTIIFISLIYIYSERDFNNFIPFITLVTVASLRLIPSFSAISGAVTEIKYTYPAFRLLKKEVENLDSFNKEKILANKQKKIEFKNTIEIENVSFKYPNTKSKVLENINLKIKFGETIGIAGKSGEGKSTLLDCVIGLLNPTSGSIKIDNVGLNKRNIKNWQKNISHVPQFIYLADLSIQENITFGQENSKIDRKKLIESCKIAEIYDFIKSKKSGFNYIVGEKGGRLSGGQKQRIGIARALYLDKELLILDESTNALDDNTEEKILNNLKKFKKDTTIIHITHKKNLMKYFDSHFGFSKNRFKRLK